MDFTNNSNVFIRLHPDDIDVLAKKIADGMAESRARPERLVDIDELTIILSVPKPTLYKWSHLSDKNGFPVSKRGKELRFKVSDVQQWLTKKPEEKRTNKRLVKGRVIRNKTCTSEAL